MMKNKKKTFILLAIIVVIITLIIIIINKNKPLSQQEKLEELFQTMIIEYYEDFYYNQIGNTQEVRELFLTKYKSPGIQINLDSLSRYNSEVNAKKIDEFVNTEINQKCDLKNTIGIIYPKEPYRKDSYEIKIKLDCGFVKEK